ncbi:unnamed protein product [Dracunculus medinensis]|uniref:NR LBD domain-containing protein n=1 Tax=Dracunculus medinensis TaxID=318479 RepID=A0A0N4UCK7_DRAME|nr:unnamed protein product [Dracunculus medinensis]
MEPEFVSSQCGTRKLVINGFTYVCQRKGERRTHWRCDRYQKDKCRATALTENGKVHIKHATHNHPANTSIFVSKRLYSKLKMAMLQSSESVPEIIRRVLSMNNEEAAIAKLPTFETLCNSMRKFRAKVQQARANQATDPSVFSVFSVDPRLSSTNNDLYNASSAEESFGINIDGLNLSNIAEFNSGSAGTRFDEPIMEDVVATSSTSQAGDKADNSEMMEYKVFENAKTQLENWERKQLCNVRKIAESSISRRSIMAMFSNNDEPNNSSNEYYNSCTYAELVQYRQLEIPFLIEFLTKAFTELSHLEKDIKVSIFKNFAPYFWLIEIGYSSINFETGSRRLIVSMLRYVDSVCLPDFLEKKKSSEKLMSSFCELFDGIHEHIVVPMQSMKILEGEFALLVALLLSESGAKLDSNDDLVAIRDNVLREIESYYRFNNIECYAFRIAALVRMTFFVMELRKQFSSQMEEISVDNVFEVAPFF